MTAGASPAACYVHIPFCARLCPYCDFAVVTGRERETDRYLDALLREIEADPPAGPLEAIFIGGGTPSSVPTEMIREVVRALDDHHHIAPDAEVSIESNPENLGGDKVEALAEVGINRLSIGAQSFDPATLSALGRAHGPSDIAAAVKAARDCGMGSVSLDLIFGHPSETDASWTATVAAALACGPDHLSTYALTIERGTAFSRAIAAGAPAPDEDTLADRYETAADLIGEAGLVQYEVSNHAAPGHECRYNLEVWNHRPYLAYGLGAHGYRDGVRFRNVRALDAYLTRSEAGTPVRQGEERIEGWEAELERVMVGLRLRNGVRAGAGGAALLSSEGGRRLVEAGILSHAGDRIRVERPLFTDAVAREVTGLPPPNGHPLDSAQS